MMCLLSDQRVEPKLLPEISDTTLFSVLQNGHVKMRGGEGIITVLKLKGVDSRVVCNHSGRVGHLECCRLCHSIACFFGWFHVVGCRGGTAE